MATYFGPYPSSPPLGTGFVVQPVQTIKLGDTFPNALIVRVPKTDIPRQAKIQPNVLFGATVRLYSMNSNEEAPSHLRCDLPKLWRWKQQVPEAIKALFPEPTPSAYFFIIDRVQVDSPGTYQLELTLRWIAANGNVIDSKIYPTRMFTVAEGDHIVTEFTGTLGALRDAIFGF